MVTFQFPLKMNKLNHEVFKDNVSTYFPKCINFILLLSDDLLNDFICNDDNNKFLLFSKNYIIL